MEKQGVGAPESLNWLRRVPFVRDLRYSRDAGLQIRTPVATFHLVPEEKRSFLSRADINQTVAWLNHLRSDRGQDVILLARHIARPAADTLIEAKVNFADDAGNIHLELGGQYSWTVIGMAAPECSSTRRATSPAILQLLFQFVTQPESVNWPVRRLEPAAGISKSMAAQARKHLIAEGLLIRAGKRYELGPKSLLAERLVSGYGQILRPKLVVGTFRAAEKATDPFLARLRSKPSDIRYSLTGGPAADLLQNFYRGEEMPLFVRPASRDTARQLRLLPDRNGPITILNAFGEVVFWQPRNNSMLAPPWLIYAELKASSDPRAHEAAERLQREFLV
jgi:hypothetical protein